MAAIYHYTLIHGTGTTKSHRHSLTSCDMFIFSNHQYSIIKVLLRKRFISSISIPSVSPAHNSSRSLPVFYCIPENNRLYIPYAIPAADHCTDHCHSRLRPPALYALKVHLSDHIASRLVKQDSSASEERLQIAVVFREEIYDPFRNRPFTSRIFKYRFHWFLH